MRRRTKWISRALLALAAAAPAAAGTLQFWESSLGSEGVTANFPTGAALVAYIKFDADSAEGGGLQGGASEITIQPTGSMSFSAFDCSFHPCRANDDYVFTTGAAPGGKLIVNDPNFSGEEHGIHDLGAITFDAPQAPGTMPLVGCNYTDVNFVERSCNQFVLVTLPEPGTVSALLAGASLLLALTRVRIRSFA